MAYTSCILNPIIKDTNAKKIIVSKCNEPTTTRNIGFIALYEKIFIRYDLKSKILFHLLELAVEKNLFIITKKYYKQKKQKRV